jgi:hypothetical protein
MFVYGITAPPHVGADVVSHKFSMSVNGEAAKDIEVKVGDPVPEIEVEEHDRIKLTCVETDAAGKASPESPCYEFDGGDLMAPGPHAAPAVSLLRVEPSKKDPAAPKKQAAVKHEVPPPHQATRQH